MAELTLTDVRRDFGKASVIRGIDLAIRNGEFVVFVGPSGCGKSTLLRLIAGLDRVSAGSIAINGRDVSDMLPAERGIAMVFQSYALYPHMSVAKNLSFGLENLRLPRAEIDKRVAEAARMLAIEPLLDRKPKELSGGQRQRVAIGRAIVRDPKLFLFDEPLSNLDAALRVQTRAEITNLHKRLGATMIYVTHDQIEAMTMADRIAVLNAGRLEQFGAPLELFDRPVNRFVAGFIGSPRMNFYAGHLRRDGGGASVAVPGFDPVAVPRATADLADGTPVDLGIRPNHVSLAPRDDDLRARFHVDRTECVGTETYVYGSIVGNAAATVIHLPGHVSVRAGDGLDIGVARTLCHLFDQTTGLALRDAPTEAARAA